MTTNLVDQYIDDTYPGLLHAQGEELPASDIKAIYDGNGNKSAISLGRDGNGAKVSGKLEIAGDLKNNLVTYPKTPPNTLDLVVADQFTPTDLKFLGFSQLLSLLGGNIPDGIYKNPTLEFRNGILIKVSVDSTENTSRGLYSYTNTSSNTTFTPPTGVTTLKFIVTGGGSTGSYVSGNAGGTVVGFINVSEGDQFVLEVGRGGGSVRGASGTASRIYYNGIPIVTANGGVTGWASPPSSTAALGSVNNSSSKISNHLVIPGGIGAIDTDDGGDEESVGGSSYWGGAPAYGGGGGSHSKDPQGSYGTSGIIFFEW